jgi:hypothetical protein
MYVLSTYVHVYAMSAIHTRTWYFMRHVYCLYTADFRPSYM